MADYSSRSFERFTFTLREAQFAWPGERGRWVYATCARCGDKIMIGDERATDFLHKLDDHVCRLALRAGSK